MKFGVWDGRDWTQTPVMLTIDVTPLADAPELSFAPRDWPDTSRVTYGYGGQAPNEDLDATIVRRGVMTGWTVSAEPGADNVFVHWVSYDHMRDANGVAHEIYGWSGGGGNWFEIGRTSGAAPQSPGLKRSVFTQAGATYSLSLGYAGHLGYGTDHTAIGLYVDGVRVGGYAAAGGETELAWEEIWFEFVGDGGYQTIEIVSEATSIESEVRGALIDSFQLHEQLLPNTAYAGGETHLSYVVDELRDWDGSESKSLRVSNIPVGVTLWDDYDHSFTATAEATSVDISEWSRHSLGIDFSSVPAFVGTVELVFTAMATESANGDTASTTASLLVTVLAPTQAPTATEGFATTNEDTPHVFQWSEFNIADADSANLSLWIIDAPYRGQLEYFNSGTWTRMDYGSEVTRAEIDAGHVRFVPYDNESGYDGYSEEGVGDQHQSYVAFTFGVYDGQNMLSPVTMVIDVVPVADAPILTMRGAGDSPSTQLLVTRWETASNANTGVTLLPSGSLEGWTLVTGADAIAGGSDVFQVWSTGDVQPDANGVLREVAATTDDIGANWLQLSDASGSSAQTLGIERTFTTQAGNVYSLWFAFAGQIAAIEGQANVVVYVDGELVLRYCGCNENTALAWEWLHAEFVGKGTAQTVRIAYEGGEGGGVMIDSLELYEQVPNFGYRNGPVQLQKIWTELVDWDESEAMTLQVTNIPVGATLYDDWNHSFTATAGNTSVDVTEWNSWYLKITPTEDFAGTFDLTVVATSTEATTGASASTTKVLTVHVSEEEYSSPIAIDLNGDGVQTLSLQASTGRFDLLNTGNAIHSGWLSPEDGFLAIDSNGNGRIDDRSELFGGELGEGFAKLATFDTNADGLVTAQDARFSELLVWRDRDGDHQTSADELSTLAAAGIASLDTRYTVRSERQNGNLLIERSTATFTDGRSAEMADAYFAVPKTNKRAVIRHSEMANDVAGLETQRGATITVRSSLSERGDLPSKRLELMNRQSSFMPWGVPAEPGSVDALSAGAISQGESPAGAVIDWTANARQFTPPPANTSRWLPEFLGVQRGEQEDLAKLTGLKLKIPKKPPVPRSL
jgi:hypothetical protein